MVFLLVILAIYTAMNGYVFWKVVMAFPGMGKFKYLLAAAMVAFFVAAVMVRWLDRWGYGMLARKIGPPVWSWLAISFWLVCTLLVLDLWNGGAWLGALKWSKVAAMIVPTRIQVIAAISLTVLATVLALAEAQRIGLKELTIPTAKLPAGSKPIRIVQISDVHLGGGTGMNRLEKIVAIIRQVQPDIVVATGDMLDTPLDNLRAEAELLKSVQPPLGKFAIPGNHEYYLGIREAVRFYQAAGFQWLQENGVQVTPNLKIVGADDAAVLFWDKNKILDETPALESVGDGQCFKLLLKHRPEINENALGKFDLQLSGHTHGGQIFPFSLLVKLFYKHPNGYVELAKGSKLYTNVGSGTWGPPMRLLVSPEVTLITLTPEN